MKLNPSIKTVIIGLGLMGGSYAKSLTAQGYTVGAVDIRADAIDYAVNTGIIQSGRTAPDREYLSQFDLVIFGLYPTAFIEWIKTYGDMIKPGAILTDVTGIKSCVIYDVQAAIRPDLEFIAAHPMAGREMSGVENAKPEIFHDANYIVTPTEKNTPEAVALCKALGETLGFHTVTELTPEKHDEMIAFLSQLTHCIAVSLMTCRDTAALADYSGDSFRDLTRIAKINDEMWSELFLLNKKELLTQMELFEAAFSKLKTYIEEDRRDEMREMMRQSTTQRILFDKKEC